MKKKFSLPAPLVALAGMLALSGCGQTSGFARAAGSATSTAQISSYYVSTGGSDSSGNGSKTSPWSTIAYASTRVKPGSVVYVAAGVYDGSFITSVSGTSSAYITYQGATADFGSSVNCAQIAANHGDLSTCPQLVGADNTTTWENDGDYVAIQGFDVTGPGINGIYTQGNATQISGNHVHNILTDTCNDTGGSGINLNGTNAEVTGNYVHNIGPYPIACGYVQGIYFLTSGGYAKNNISFNNSGFGIQLWHQPENIQLINNTIFNNASGGIVLGTDNTDVTVDYITVRNNIVVNNGGVGIQEQGASSSSTGIHNVYTNNLLDGNASGEISLQNGLEALSSILQVPMFVNETGTSTGNYHLQSASPAIRTATSTDSPTTDFDGNARPQSGAYDIGAYEYVPSATASLSSTSLSFPSTGVGEKSDIKYVTLTNTGSGALAFASDFAISGPFAFGGTGTCALTVASNASCTISVVFEPKASGAATGAVTLTDNAASKSQKIALSGTGD
jgi:hypothetical protein